MARKIMTAAELDAEFRELLRLTGLGVLVPDPDPVIAVLTAVALALQDIERGSAVNCQCDPCATLRGVLGTIGRFLDGIRS